MTDLIPLLVAYLEAEQEAGTTRVVAAGTVSTDFVRAFVALHDDDWRRAQAHWERVVERVLDTDAVDPRARGRVAIRQAVAATVLLLGRPDLTGRCPVCPPRVPQARGESHD